MIITKGFARIHKNNLINHGIIPAVFVDPKDYEGLDLSDELSVTGLRQQMKEKMVTVHNLTKGTNFQARLELTDGEVEILLAGGKLRFYKAKLQ